MADAPNQQQQSNRQKIHAVSNNMILTWPWICWW